MKECIVCTTELSGKQRKYCSNNCKQKAHYHYHKNNSNTYHSQTKRGATRKLMFVKEKGGECKRCGYNKNYAALEFHHLKDKEFPLDYRHFSNRSLKKLRNEAKKCILLCANCHRELHSPDMEKDSFENFVESLLL